MDFNADVCRAAIGNQRNVIVICLADGIAMFAQGGGQISRLVGRWLAATLTTPHWLPAT
jgi:hypothetical protein